VASTVLGVASLDMRGVMPCGSYHALTIIRGHITSLIAQRDVIIHAYMRDIQKDVFELNQIKLKIVHRLGI
jgi:hypothetical protein